MNPKALLGQRLADKYTLESLLGVGGFGAVYRARQAPIDRLVAVKINLHSHRSDLQARFVREARLQAELRHPGCVMLLDCGETDGLFYLVQEFVDGISLKQALAQGPLAARRAVELVDQVLGALGEAHRHHIVHRDIKPANVMITRRSGGREEARVLDFGIAKLLVDDSEDTESLTGTGMSLGTPAYMAPEQIRPGPIGPPTDLYAVGAMLFRLVTGRPVFSGATIDVLTQQLSAPPPPLPKGLQALDPIIRRAMAKTPADRYQSAAEMSAALREVDRAALVGLSSPTTADNDRTLLTPSVASTMADGDPTLVTPSPAPAPMPSRPIAPPAPPDPSLAPPPATPMGGLGPTAPRNRRLLGVAILLGAVILGSLAVFLVLRGAADHSAEGAAADANPPAAADARVVAPLADSGPLDGPPAEAGLVDAGPDAGPDAEPAPAPGRRRRRPTRPAAPDSATLEARFDAQIDACRCDEARRTLRRLGPGAADRRAALTERYEAACILLLPGNCASR